MKNIKKVINYHSILGENNPLLKYHNLYDAALDEFSNKKYEEASLNEILKQANMSKGSFYHNFGDKFGLYLSLVDIMVKRKTKFFLPILKEQENKGDFFGTLREIMKKTMEYMFLDQRVYHLSNTFLESDENFRKQVIDYFPFDFNQTFGVLISEAIKQKQISNKYTKEFVINFLNVIFTNSHKLLHRFKDVDNMLDQLFNLIKFGFSYKEDNYE